ncbi:hypothetical protein VNI00_004713 [Paramarasmius palmivorus]|uniref:Uncharacterized protein n=1 Tax=Paramarasmius palmivorus TaxID=297713 RepID=A0AAW0DJH7_9AGAR
MIVNTEKTLPPAPSSGEIMAPQDMRKGMREWTEKDRLREMQWGLDANGRPHTTPPWVQVTGPGPFPSTVPEIDAPPSYDSVEQANLSAASPSVLRGPSVAGPSNAGPSQPPHFHATRTYSTPTYPNFPQPQPPTDPEPFVFQRPRQIASSSHLRTHSNSLPIPSSSPSPSPTLRHIESKYVDPSASTTSFSTSTSTAVAQSSTTVNETSTTVNATLSPPVFVPKSKKGWFGNKKRTKKEAREWVTTQVSDLVQQAQSSPTDFFETARNVLGGCSEACVIHSLSLSDILQEKFIEAHTPFYWAVVQRPTSSDSRGAMPDLLRELLSFGTPLTEETRSDIRRACLMVNDQGLFHALRSTKDYMPASVSHNMIFGGRLPPDEIVIEDKPGGEQAFAANLEIAFFRKRMNFAKEVVIEFIAQRRIWRLAFTAPENKKGHEEPHWKLTLSLLEHSPPTYVDSRLIIHDSASVPPLIEGSFTDDSPGSSPTTSTAPQSSYSSPYSTPPPKTLHQSQSAYFYPSQNEFYPGYLRGTSVAAEDKDRRASIAIPGSSATLVNRRDMHPPRTDSNSSTATTGSKKKKGKVLNLDNLGSDKPKPDVTIRLKASSMITPGKKEIEVSLEDGTLMGTTLRSPNSTYISAEETLKARFEARLAKPESDCVIC